MLFCLASETSQFSFSLATASQFPSLVLLTFFFFLMKIFKNTKYIEYYNKSSHVPLSNHQHSTVLVQSIYLQSLITPFDYFSYL